MEFVNSQHFSMLSGELCNYLYLKDYDKTRVNSIIDELNTKPYKASLFVNRSDGTALVTALCLNISQVDAFLAVKASHLMTNVTTRQNLQLGGDFMAKVISWHIRCLAQCSDMVSADIIHNLQCMMHCYPQVTIKFTDELIGEKGILLKFIKNLSSQDSLTSALISLKCICALTAVSDENKLGPEEGFSSNSKSLLANTIVDYLMKGLSKKHDEFICCKIVIYSLRILAQLYFGQLTPNIPLPEVMGICRYYVLYGMLVQAAKPDRIMPAQQTIAAPVSNVPKSGKKQKLRKQRNNAIESLKKDIPVSDRSLLKDFGNFDNNSAYKPASQNYFEAQKNNSTWPQTSDSDMSDFESNREAKLIALKSRVRQSASNLLLVLIKVTEKKDMFGYWWALLPDNPNPENWASQESSKKTLAYCAVYDPIGASRMGALNVILALLSGSRMYLSQAEASKKGTISFIPFSVSLGYTISCLHKVLTGILENEISLAVILVTLKCCAALAQATPYHKMDDGLITKLVESSRKFLFHRDVRLQVGTLILIGCILSIDPKVDELLKAIEKDSLISKDPIKHLLHNNIKHEEKGEIDDFEEGYSDDDDNVMIFEDNQNEDSVENNYFKSWILDKCFWNLGWAFKKNEVVKCKQSGIKVILESLQVISAVAFHHFESLLHPHLHLLADVLCQMLQDDHQEIILQAAKTVSIIGDAILKLELESRAPPLPQRVFFWEKVLAPLSNVLQCEDNPLAKAVACDCIANVGENVFKELPRKVQVVCCTLLVGSCGDEDAAVRAAAVRALAMAVMYRTLREDVCFVSDCGENILRALNETTLAVRTKAAWALGNLSDALVLNMDDPEIDTLDDDLLFRLLEVSVHCATDNDKIKMSATRGLGNLLKLIQPEQLLRNPKLKPLCENAITKLNDCTSKASNMKVRWNACYAMGNAMKNDALFNNFSGWQNQVFTNLSNLTQECKNLKVRINAAVALRSPRSRAQYAANFIPIWRSVMAAVENAANVDDYSEYKHKDNLIEQLFVTLSHLCCQLIPSDLSEILDPLTFHFDCAKSLSTQLCHKLPPENMSCVKILEAAKYLTMSLNADTEAQQIALGMLQEIFIWDM